MHRVSAIQTAALSALLFGLLAGCAAKEKGQDDEFPASSRTIEFTVMPGYIQTPEANSIFVWGIARGDGEMQYPGPTVIATAGETVEIVLNNKLDRNMSLAFPGQMNVKAVGGQPGLITREAKPGEAVRYFVTADSPGTYMYHGASNPDIDVEMGVIGAFIVRPTADPRRAYDSPDSEFDREVMFLMTEMDPIVHELVGTDRLYRVDSSRYFATYWFINGRAGPDTMLEARVPWLPHQPYNCMPVMHPGEKVLLRIITASRDQHPLHTHGNHFKVIAFDGRPLQSSPDSGIDLAEKAFTLSTNRLGHMGTADAIWTWTGEKLGWDPYGHAPGDPMEPGEYAPDHGKPFPVTMPGQMDLTVSINYSGSPFLGGSGYRPPGDFSPNMNGGYFFMWHSHKEKELTNNNVFPGGLLTMALLEHPDVPIMSTMIEE